MKMENTPRKKPYQKPEIREFKADGENPWVLGNCPTECTEFIFPAGCQAVNPQSE